METNLRLVEEGDSAQIAEIYRFFVEHTAVSFESEAPDASETSKRIREIKDEYPWLVADSGGRVAGYAYASRHRVRYHYQWAVDVSVYVHAEYRRMGIGKMLYRTLVDVLPLQGFVTAHAGITIPNEASVRLHESFGFKPSAVYKNVGYKLGSWHDVGWWQLQLADPPSEPKPPLPLVEVASRPEWIEKLRMVGS